MKNETKYQQIYEAGIKKAFQDIEQDDAHRAGKGYSFSLKPICEAQYAPSNEKEAIYSMAKVEAYLELDKFSTPKTAQIIPGKTLDSMHEVARGIIKSEAPERTFYHAVNLLSTIQDLKEKKSKEYSKEYEIRNKTREEKTLANPYDTNSKRWSTENIKA